MNLQLDKVTEVWSYQYNGKWYELHVNATEQRYISEIFCEDNSLITDEMIAHFENVVSNIS